MSTVQHGFYKTHYDSSNIDKSFAAYLDEKLPHGSGIDYDWEITFDEDRKTVFAENSYHAMNESGMYCHAWPFRVTIPVITTPDPQFPGYYLPDSIDQTRLSDELDIEFIDCDPENDCPDKDDLLVYAADYIQEHGTIDDDMIENTPTGCGYGLADAIYDIIYNALTEA